MKYVVMSPVKHGKGGKVERLVAGDRLELTEKEAAPLLASHSVRKPTDPQAVKLLAEIKEREAAEAERLRLQEELEAKETADREAAVKKAAEDEAERQKQLQAGTSTNGGGTGTGTGTGTDPSADPLGTGGQGSTASTAQDAFK
jgi:membrane protein involved in colicin uptake